MSILKRLLYHHRSVPSEYASDWIAAEFANVERAIPARTIVPVTAAYTAQPSDDVILADPTGGAFAVTLESPTTPCLDHTIKNTTTGGNLVTITGTVDGVANPTLASNKAMRVVSDGAKWQKVASV